MGTDEKLVSGELLVATSGEKLSDGHRAEN